MEECHTPTFQQLHNGFNLDPTATPLNSCRRNAQMFEQLRCYTPQIPGFTSPNLSPICEIPSSIYRISHVRNLSFEGYKTPKMRGEFFDGFTPSSQGSNESSKLRNPDISGSYVSPSPGKLADLSTSSKNVDSTILDKDADRSWLVRMVLNSTLTVHMLLQYLGLECYIEHFEKSGINLNNFLRLNHEDLINLGIKSYDDCKLIENLLHDLNFK